MNKIKTKTEVKSSDEKYIEMLEILEDSKQIKGRQLVVGADNTSLREIDELKELLQKKMDDPQEKWELYYKGIQNIMKKYLPKGKSFSKYRQIIYDEKNIFLNRGKAKDKSGRRGSDSRMTYNEDMKEMVDIVANWIMSSQNPTDLYIDIYKLNEKYNYGHQYYDKTSVAFNNSMKNNMQ